MISRSRIIILALICSVVAVLVAVLLPLIALFGETHRAWRASIAIDQVANALTGGSEDETISSRTGRAQRDGALWGRLFAPCVDLFFGKDHCRDNIGE